MFNIDRHIEILLLKHDCVIVPGFGGFVAHHVSAQFDEDDRTMLPPKTTVGFNQQLTMNDSLLVQSYIETYDYSYPEALRVLNDEIEQLRSMIQEYGHFDINSVGRLSLNKDGNYEFEPVPAGILAPRLYGLSGVATIDTEAFLSKTLTENKPQMTVHKTEFEESNSDKFIRISTAAIRRGMVACIVILMLMVIPLMNRSINTHQLMSGIDTSFLTGLVNDSNNAKPANVKKVVKVIIPVKQTNIVATKTLEQTKETTSQTNIQEAKECFTVVLAARIAQANAEIYVNELHERGFDSAKVIGDGKSRKVVYGSFSSRKEAQEAKNRLSTESEFEYAWVTKL